MKVRIVAAGFLGLIAINIACVEPIPQGAAAGGGDPACVRFSQGTNKGRTEYGLQPALMNAKFGEFARAVTEATELVAKARTAVSAACGGYINAFGVVGVPADGSGDMASLCRQVASPPSGRSYGVVVAYKPTECGPPPTHLAECATAYTGASCDLVASPPRCDGGRLMISCSSECVPTAEQPRIRCGGGGVCQGTCTSRCLPGVPCDLPCDCNASCRGPGMLACDGKCAAQFSLSSCLGGVWTLGCQAPQGAPCVPRAQLASVCEVPPVTVTTQKQLTAVQREAGRLAIVTLVTERTRFAKGGDVDRAISGLQASLSSELPQVDVSCLAAALTKAENERAAIEAATAIPF